MTATDLVVEFMPGAGPLDVAGDYYLSLTGTALGTAGGSKATTPDVAALDIVGDIDVRVDFTAAQWTAPPGTLLKLIGKGNLSASDRSWILYTDVNRKLVFRWTTNGTTSIDSVSTVAVPISAGRLAVRVTLDVDDGAGNRVTTFYTAPTIDGSWTQLGAVVTTAGTTSIWNSATALEIGDVIGTSFPSVKGRCHAAEIRNGVGGSDIRANPNFAIQPPGTISFADAAGRTWTVNSPATIVGFDWEEISEQLLYATWTIGRADELEPFPAGTAQILLKNDERLLDPEYTAGTWYGQLEPRTPFRIQSIASALDLPGTAGATASTPDHADYAVTDIDVRLQLAMDDWTPGGFGVFLVGQWPNVGGNNGWAFTMDATGHPAVTWTTDGTTTVTRTSTVATGFTDGSDHWLRLTHDVNNGAAGHTVTFYTSTDGITWTTLDTVTTGGTTSIFNSTAALTINDVLPFAGQVRYLELRSSIGGSVVTRPEFTSQNAGTRSFKDRSDRTWTVNGAAVIVLDTVFRTDEFYGFVGDEGFQQISQPPSLGNCQVQLADLLDILGEDALPQTAYDAEVLANSPEAFWKLDETTGTQMADSSGNGRHGVFDNSILGQEPLVKGAGHSAEFPHVGDHRGRWSGEGLPVGAPTSIEAWVRTTRDAAATKSLVVVQRDASLGARLWLGIQTSAAGSPDGEIVIDFAGLGTNYKARGSTRIDDDEIHHVVLTFAGNTAAEVLLYVDGALETKTLISGTNPGSWTSLLLWTVGNYTNTGAGDFGFDGFVDEVAVYSYVLTAEQVADLYEAGTTAFAETSGERIDRVLDILGVPAALRDIATGDTTVGPAAYEGANAGTYMQAVAESEQGYLYVDHRNGGKLTFKGRYHRHTDTRSLTSQATFSDSTTETLHYERDGLVVDPRNARSIVNIVDVEWRGGSVQARSQSSIDSYGPRTRSLTTEAATPTAGLSAGDWIINRNSQPRERVRAFRLHPGADARLRAPARALRINDRITFGRHPQQVGSATTKELIVEGLTHTFERGVDWSTSVRTSAADTGDVWIWGTSTWGETTIWG